MKKIVSLLIATALLGCAGLPQNATPQEKAAYAIAQAQKYSPPLITAAVTAFLITERNPANQSRDAAYIYSGATALYTFSSGSVPSAADVQAAVQAFAKGDPRYVQLAQIFVSQYASLYPLFGVAGKSPTVLFQAWALAAMNGAKPFLAVPSSPTP